MTFYFEITASTVSPTGLYSNSGWGGGGIGDRRRQGHPSGDSRLSTIKRTSRHTVPQLYFYFCLYFQHSQGQYFSLERPRVLYYNTEFITNITFKSQRVSRSDPVHYVNLTFNLNKILINEYKVRIYIITTYIIK